MLDFGYIKVGTIDEIMELLRPLSDRERAEQRVQAAKEEVRYWSTAEKAASDVFTECTRRAAMASRELHEADVALKHYESDEEPDREVADPEGPNATKTDSGDYGDDPGTEPSPDAGVPGAADAEAKME